ncbi:hypothetical protein AMTRI_Chr05g60450 [Amborella trichopoda]
MYSHHHLLFLDTKTCVCLRDYLKHLIHLSGTLRVNIDLVPTPILPTCKVGEMDLIPLEWTTSVSVNLKRSSTPSAKSMIFGNFIIKSGNLLIGIHLFFIFNFVIDLANCFFSFYIVVISAASYQKTQLREHH